MKLEITDSNYACSVVEIKTIRPHSNADRLNCTSIFGNNVIVGKDVQVGDFMLYFPLESQIGQDFAFKNDLIKRKDVNGKPAGGMFELNRRVKCLKLRGERSEGFLIPFVSIFNLFDVHLPDLKVGVEFNSINGIEICKKYIPRGTRIKSTVEGKGKRREPKFNRLIPNQFRFHFDTAQLGKNLHLIQPDTLLSITKKLHGTSFVVSNCLVKRKLKWYELILQKLGVKIHDTEYSPIYSSRKVIKNENPVGFYGDTDLWGKIAKGFNGLLHAGETLYGEAVGYTSDGRAIQKGYDYGCEQNTYDIYIYRITRTGVDGNVTELSFPQIKDRCQELNVKHVPELFYEHASVILTRAGKFSEIAKLGFEEAFLNYLREYVESEGREKMCKNDVPSEGIVLRIEDKQTLTSLKLKSFEFLGYETKMLDENVLDIETQESEVTV